MSAFPGADPGGFHSAGHGQFELGESGLHACGADGAAEYFNPRWYEYTGQTPEQARGDGWMRALHPDDVANTLAATRRSIASGEPLNVEYRLRRGTDGAYRWFLSRGLSLSDPAGGPMQWIGSCSDIDEQKRAGESLRFLSEVSGAYLIFLKSVFTKKIGGTIYFPKIVSLGMEERAKSTIKMPLVYRLIN